VAEVTEERTPVLIGLDWGTTSLRAWLLDEAGRILERVERPAGILEVEDGDFERVFAEAVGPWRDRGLPALASGMIGARQGWREVPYAACPAGGAELAAGLVAVPNRTSAKLSFVPGLVCRGPSGVPDVMRGEETQILGVMAGGGGLVVLPGTHSKWAEVEEGRVVRFATFMTGELFAVLARHSILGRMMTPDGHGDEDPEAFARGVAYGAAEDGLLGRLFSARTLPLLGELPESGVRDYLSGLLIGAELREARRLPGARGGDVTVVAGGALGGRYGRALGLLGIACTRHGEEAAARGLVTIARAAGLVA
jgi:2-dehydro-3-deoxygalactonokinase